MKRFVLSLALVALLLCAPFMRSQDASTPTLRLTARDVYIPVWVVTRSDPNVGQVGVLGLQPADFHVHVDDVDIPVKTVAFHEERIWCVHEKTGSVREGSYLSFGIWTNPASGCMENEDRDDLLQRLRNSGLLRGPPWKSRWDIYTLSFNPPNSGTAGCHKVKVSVTTADLRTR